MSAVDALCRSWLDLRWHLDPVAASLAGERTHDLRWGRYDAASMKEAGAALRSLAAATEDLDVESVEEEIDRTALLEEMRVAQQRLEHERPHERNPHWWLHGIFEGLWVLSARGDTPAEFTPALLERLKGVPDQLTAARATLVRPPLVHVDQALASLGGGGALIAELAGAAALASEERREEIMGVAAKALEALRGFGNALNQEMEPDHDPHAFALGEMPFTQRLHHEHALRGGPQELHRQAVRLREELEVQLGEEARALAGHTDWRALVVRLIEEAPAPVDLVGAAAGELRRLHAVMEEHGLADGLQVASAAITPPHLRMLYPIALYRPALATELPGTVYLTPDADGALGEHAEAALTGLLVREGVPGRHAFSQRARTASTLVRRSLAAPTMIGGWGLTALDLAEECDAYASPEARLFRLVLLLQGAVRVEIDVGLHTRNMARGAAIELLTGTLPMSRRTADAEVRRCCGAPTHHLCDAVGRRDLMALRRDVQRQRGTEFSLAGFWNEIGRYGGLPIPLIRWGMGVDE